MQYTFLEGRSGTGSNYAFLKPAESLSPASRSLSLSLWQLGRAQCSRVRFLHRAWLMGFCVGTWRLWSRRPQAPLSCWEGSAPTLQVKAAAWCLQSSSQHFGSACVQTSSLTGYVSQHQEDVFHNALILKFVRGMFPRAGFRFLQSRCQRFLSLLWEQCCSWSNLSKNS